MLAVFDNLCPPNSINNIYDYLDNKINFPCDEILSIKIYNFTPIIYNGIKLLLTTFLGLEHLFLDKNNKIIIKYFLDEKTYGDIVLNKHINLLKIKKFNSDILSEFDSFYDEHTQLLFIKFNDICIEYFDISNFNLLRLMNSSFINEKIIISNIDYSLNKLTINSEINTNYIYKQKYFTLPSLPYLYTITDSIMPLIGSSVVNYNNELIGIVNLINLGNKIMITPLISIIRSLKYLESNNNLLITNFDYTIETLDISNLKNESNLKNVLKITNLITKNSRINNQEMFITSINDYLIADDGTIIYNNNNIPLSTYIWLNMFNRININYLKYKNKELISKSKTIYLKKLEKISNISISKLIYINTKNTFIFELNEKILSIITDYMVKNIDYKNILQKIYDNKFSIKRKKILLFIKLNKNNVHHFELIEDYYSITDINEKLNITNSLEIKLNKYSIKLVKN
jgi:hypothetical protein